MRERRRFPQPWTIGETPACYYVQDASGHRVAYCYFTEPRPGYSHDVTKMTRAEAHRIARAIAKLPDLLQEHAAIRESTEKASDRSLVQPN